MTRFASELRPCWPFGSRPVFSFALSPHVWNGDMPSCNPCSEMLRWYLWKVLLQNGCLPNLIPVPAETKEAVRLSVPQNESLCEWNTLQVPWGVTRMSDMKIWLCTEMLGELSRLVSVVNSAPNPGIPALPCNDISVGTCLRQRSSYNFGVSYLELNSLI